MTESVPPSAPRERRLPARVTFLLVVGAFVAPIAIAWWYAYVAPPGATTHHVNHGHLLSPPLDIRREPAMAPLREFALAPGEWAMIYFTADACDASCAEAASMLDSIRMVIGQNATRVRIGVLADAAGDVTAPPHLFADANARRRLAAATATGNDVPTSGVVFLDWRGQIMMFFPDLSDPAGIKADIKRLLLASKIS